VYRLGSIENVWYGTMPNWDTSLVEDMSGYDGGVQGFGGCKYIRRRYFEVGHRESDYYDVYMFSTLLRSTKTLGVGTQRK